MNEVMGPGILLIQPPLDISRDFVDYPYHSDLSVVQAASVLKAESFPVRVVDAFALPGSDLEALGRSRLLLGAPVEDVLDAAFSADGSRAPPKVVIISYGAFNRPPFRDDTLAELLRGLRAGLPDTPLLLADLYQGGQHYVAAAGEAVLDSYPEVDGVLQHEAEDVLASLCMELAKGGRPARRIVRSGGESGDLGGLAPPAWDEIDLFSRDAFMERVIASLGRGAWAFPIDGRTLPALTSRGCPYSCAHCSSNPGRGEGPKTQRRLDATAVRALFDALKQRFGATRVHLLDEMANVRPGHLDTVLEELRKRGLSYELPNGLRADHLESRHLDAMKGRISTLSISAESGVQRVVDEVVGKRLDLAHVERVLAGAREREIPALVHFIIGMPGERAADINDTLEAALGLHARWGAIPSVQYAAPLPGTALATRAPEPAPCKGDWCPVFQKKPVTSGEDFGPEDLAWFKWTFDQRMAASRGTAKVILNVTYRCNNRCVFCAVGGRAREDGDFAGQGEILARHAEAGVTALDVDGGEPTLHPKLIPLLMRARALGYERVNVTTNGRMCAYEEYARAFVRSGLTSVLFSVHGAAEETHARHVGVKEAFEQTITGIENCARHRPPSVELGMNVTVTRHNQRELGALAGLAERLGLSRLNLQFLTPFGRATSELAPDMEEAARAAMEVIDAWGEAMTVKIVNLPFCFMPGYEPHLAGDLGKAQRRMVFVNTAEVNLGEYLLARRHYREECAGCRHRVFCGGYYEQDATPEPAWAVKPTGS